MNKKNIILRVTGCKECMNNIKENKKACKKHKREWEEYLQIDKKILETEQRNQRFSENTQHIYRMHPCTKTPFGRRVMTEVGVIQSLRIDTTYNYVLIPVTNEDRVTAWHIVPLQRKLPDPLKDEVVEDTILDAIKKAEPYDEWRPTK